MPPEAIYAIQDLVTTFLVSACVVGLAFSPIARGIGQRILHGRVPHPNLRDGGRVEDLSEEVSALRRQLDETLDRIEFAERVVAQGRERGQLGAPPER